MEKVRVLSLGAGVQSSALCYMYERGDLDGRPDFAVFADTQREPAEVYEFFEKLKREIWSFPIYVATKGDLGEWPNKIPFFLKHPNGKRGMGWRQCTNDFKIQVVNKEVRRVLGYRPRQRWRHHIEMIMGISCDEAQREKISQDKWRTNVYPLLEGWMTRQDCIDYCKSIGVTPPRSACYFCPYRSKREWAEMKKNHPEDFQRAVEYDRFIRTDAAKRQGAKAQSRLPQYLSYDLVPLDEMDLSHIDPKSEFEHGMGNECEGMCGV